MMPTDGSELKRKLPLMRFLLSRLDSDFTPNFMPLVLYGSPAECNIDVQWETCDSISLINSNIADHTVPVELANPLDWSFDVYLIEIDDVHTDVVYSNMNLNGTLMKAKQDTGAR